MEPSTARIPGARRRILTALIFMGTGLGVLPGTAPQALAQDVSPDTGPLRLFVDCQFGCDMDYLRTQVDWVDYMRDAADAQVHLMITAEGTAGGGQRQTLHFLGRRELAGMADTLHFVSTSEDSQDTRRQGLTRVIAAGLVRFAARLDHYGERLRVSMVAPPAATGAAEAAALADDPWNFWTFRVGASGNADGESERSNYGLSGSLSANRTTEAWKINLTGRGSYFEQSFSYFSPLTQADTTITSIRRSYSLSALLVKSVGPHLSVGARGGLNTSTYGNTEVGWNLAPAVEYNLFPYSESTRRSLTATYSAGLRAFDYRERTLYGEDAETRPIHTLDVGYATRQPWGTVSVNVMGSQYLHDTSFFSGDVGGGLSEIRLFRGFTVGVFGNYSMVRDQITLPARTLTPDEILLRQREIATNYRYFVSLNIGYRFGSIFNNVVNPRMGGGGGMGMMFF